MTIKSGQKMYRLRGPDGKWAQKGQWPFPLKWVENEERATFWKKLAHVKSSLKDGVLANRLEGLPEGSIQVVEYEVTFTKTGRKHRLTELERFHEKKQEDKEDGD